MLVEAVNLNAIKSKKLNPAKVYQWLDQYWAGGERPCPVCHESQWAISAEPVEVKSFRWGKPTGGGTMEIFMTITCETCGNSNLINVLAADLMEIQE